jgi:hypothetical protein
MLLLIQSSRLRREKTRFSTLSMVWRCLQPRKASCLAGKKLRLMEGAQRPGNGECLHATMSADCGLTSCVALCTDTAQTSLWCKSSVCSTWHTADCPLPCNSHNRSLSPLPGYRKLAKMRLSANAKSKVHLNEPSKAPKQSLQPLPPRSKFARIQHDREARRSTLSMYMDSSLMDSPAREASPGAGGGKDRSRRGIPKGAVRLSPISVGGIIPAELLDQSVSSVDGEAAGGQHPGWGTLHGGTRDRSGVRQGEEDGEGCIRIYTVAPRYTY